MSNAKHTPIPWYIATADETLHIQSAKTNEDNYVLGIRLDELNAEANAEFIVRCVNNHERLLEACKEALKEFKEMGYVPPKAIALLQQAIEKAERG